MEHPAADYAKDVMQVAVAGTGVHLSDGSTNILPVGDRRRRSGRPGGCTTGWSGGRWSGPIYQGWDLHPAQLPTRFIANFAFYREGFARAAAPAARLRDQAPDRGSWTSRPPPGRWPATCTAGYVCGAVTEPSCRRGRSRRRPARAAGPAEVRHRERRRSTVIQLTPSDPVTHRTDTKE